MEPQVTLVSAGPGDGFTDHQRAKVATNVVYMMLWLMKSCYLCQKH
jgi:hypothetical protein